MVINVKKIDLILPIPGSYPINDHLTKEICKAFIENKIEARLLSPPKNKDAPENFLNNLVGNHPDCTFSINGILPDEEGRFLADLLKIPHISYLINSPTNYFRLKNSPFTVIASNDLNTLITFEEIGVKNSIFLPGAVSIPLKPPIPINKRSIDILMIPDFINPNAIHHHFESTLPSPIVGLLESAAFSLLTDKETFLYRAFLEGYNHFSIKEMNEYKSTQNLSLIHQLEMYARGKDQLELLKSFEGMQVDLIITPGTKNQWMNLLKDYSVTFRFHEISAFDRINSLIRESKIVLNSTPQIKKGSNGALFNTISEGAFSFHSQNPWLEEKYNEEKGAYFYPYFEPEKIRNKAKELLENETKLEEFALNGREYLLKNDTWNQRAKEFLAELPFVLSTIPEKIRMH
ncbi:glycosyltransferase [Chlamydiales bacterium]|nr:glycosyltransferase [Chlamydiales bacterium]